MLLPVRKKYPGGLRASLAAGKMKKEHQDFWWYSLPLCRRAGLFPDNRPQRAGGLFPGSRLSPDALFLPVALCHADSVHRAHILPGSRVTECLPGFGGMVLPVVVLLNPAEPGSMFPDSGRHWPGAGSSGIMRGAHAESLWARRAFPRRRGIG